MLTTTVLQILLVTSAFPGTQTKANAATQSTAPQLAIGKSAQGMVTLDSGVRLHGTVVKTRKGWVVKRDGKRLSFTDDEVDKFVSRDELLRTFARLAKRTDAGEIFGQAQLALWAFENGLTDKAWPLLGQLYASNQKVPGLDKIEKLAARSYVEEFARRQKLETKARRILLEANNIKGHPVRQAKNRVTPEALGLLLERERKEMSEAPLTKKNKKRRKTQKSLASYAKSRKSTPKGKVEQLLREYAEEALSTHRRILARRALMEDTAKNQAFVYRLAVRFPDGPNRRDILQEIFDQDQVDQAATYLSRQIRYDAPLLIKARTAEVLGDLGSPIALPALRKTKEALRSPALKRKASGGGGGSRAYIAVTTQTSYIRDFNVEVAQAAAIANPEVDVIESGTVLDAKVLGVDWTRYIVYLDSRLDRAIEKITKKAANK